MGSQWARAGSCAATTTDNIAQIGRQAVEENTDKKIKKTHRCTKCQSPNTYLADSFKALPWGTRVLFRCLDCNHLFQIWSIPL
jgi:hypothetical protein